MEITLNETDGIFTSIGKKLLLLGQEKVKKFNTKLSDVLSDEQNQTITRKEFNETIDILRELSGAPYALISVQEKLMAIQRSLENPVKLEAEVLAILGYISKRITMVNEQLDKPAEINGGDDLLLTLSDIKIDINEILERIKAKDSKPRIIENQ
jgi:hypothetical protein